MRIILAAVLGGIVMFAWGAVSHMVLNIEGSVVKPMPNEAAVTAAMKSNLSEPGVYIAPGIDMTKTATEEEQQAWATRYKDGPTMMLIYQPAGTDVFTPKQFLTQLGADVGAALFGSIILLFASVGFARGVIISTLIGIAGWIAILIPYWNWYRFPFEFVRADLIDQIAGWFLAGLVMAFFMRRREATAA
ncbi:MAG TPA: hypothetical protein VGO43_15925 [Pyrinomonadaceae bacterium]|jgi:hypothetical protein|nr:hypothetical protein [Pyrinomonadaceae bacterium]